MTSTDVIIGKDRAYITAPFAAWTAADLVWAIDHLPIGQQHRTRTANIRHPAAWLRWRLSLWLSTDGTTLPSPTQQRAENAQHHRAYLAARRTEHTERGADCLPDHLQLAAGAEARRQLAARGVSAIAAATGGHSGAPDAPAGPGWPGLFWLREMMRAPATRLLARGPQATMNFSAYSPQVAATGRPVPDRAGCYAKRHLT